MPPTSPKDMLRCESVTSSGVFATLAFFDVAKTSKILRLWIDFGASG